MDTSTKLFLKIRQELESIKLRLDNAEKTLIVQEELLDELNQNTKSLLKEAFGLKETTNLQEEIIRRQFPKGRLPKILFKNNN